MKTALIILATGFEEIEAITVIDVLRRGGVAVTVAGLDNIEITGAHNIKVRADLPLEQVKEKAFDMIILPGGGQGTENLKSSKTVLNLVQKQYKQQRYVAAICAAPTVLAKAGITDKHLVTSYPGTQGAFKDGQVSDANTVISGNIITGRAPGAAMDFALVLLETLEGNHKMSGVQNELVYTAHQL